MSLSVERWSWPDVPKDEWGPKGWNWLHVLAINYPPAPTLPAARLTFRRIWNFAAHLPCIECRWHATRHILRHPPDLSGTEALQAWVWAFHNAVNARLGKPQVPFERYLRLYADELCLANWTAGCSLR